MPTRQLITESINTRRQQNRSIEDELINVINNVIVTQEDGIFRSIDNANQESSENGYLVISSGSDVDSSRHLALKVDNNKFWTISAIKGGTELEIGIIENGEHRSVISFNENAALSLNEALNLGAGLKAIQLNGKLKGIPTSGIKGFIEGRLKASGNWESTDVKIPENTFGKYKLQAWLIQQDENRFSHLETVFVFFPGKPPVQKVKYQSISLSKLRLLIHQIEKWVLKRLKKDVEIENVDWKARLYAKIDKNSGEILIKCNSVIDPNRKLVFYSIERLWEGEHWIDSNS